MVHRLSFCYSVRQSSFSHHITLLHITAESVSSHPLKRRSRPLMRVCYISKAWFVFKDITKNIQIIIKNSSRNKAIKWIHGTQDYFYWWVLSQPFVKRRVLQACLITRLKNTFLMVGGPEVLRIVTDWICSVWGMFEHFKLDEKRLETDKV